MSFFQGSEGRRTQFRFAPTFPTSMPIFSMLAQEASPDSAPASRTRTSVQTPRRDCSDGRTDGRLHRPGGTGHQDDVPSGYSPSRILSKPSMYVFNRPSPASISLTLGHQALRGSMRIQANKGLVGSYSDAAHDDLP
ncbi:MAG: hypothetical protein MZV70_43745 [Desulfobacterales bacterium]|nr:hypothetical protein [Desulfobacterales bacterium]